MKLLPIIVRTILLLGFVITILLHGFHKLPDTETILAVVIYSFLYQVWSKAETRNND